MSSYRFASITALVIGLIMSLPVAQAKKKASSAYNAQTSYTFTNGEQSPAHGLVVVLSSDAEVVTDPSTGGAGPFGNVQGNGTSKITLTNPSSLIVGVVVEGTADEGASEEGATEEGATEEGATEEAATDEGADAEGASLHLVFRTSKKKLSVKNWWWLDEKGKRLGDKQKG